MYGKKTIATNDMSQTSKQVTDDESEQAADPVYIVRVRYFPEDYGEPTYACISYHSTHEKAKVQARVLRSQVVKSEFRALGILAPDDAGVDEYLERHLKYVRQFAGCKAMAHDMSAFLDEGKETRRALHRELESVIDELRAAIDVRVDFLTTEQIDVYFGLMAMHEGRQRFAVEIIAEG